MATVIDTTAATLDALQVAWRAALPVPPTNGTDDGLGVDVLVGPDQDRTAVPRAVTIAAAFNAELDPLTVTREERGLRPNYTDTITVMCSVLVQGSEQAPDRDFHSWREQASVILGKLGGALRSSALTSVVARARLLSDRWYDAYDGVGGGPMAVVVDVQIELTVLS